MQNKREQFIYHFFQCGIAGWCLEVLFTSMESVMLKDWRLMAKTSLLMFPIYGMGAILPEICGLVDWWLGGERLDWDGQSDPPWDTVYRVDFYGRVSLWKHLKSLRHLSMGLYGTS